MLKHMTRRLRDRTVVTAAILALTGYNACAGDNDSLGGSRANDRKTDSPIKHVIIIMGENRTFDHVFATYVPRDGQFADNLLSKGIITIDGAPGPNYAKASQFAAEDINFYSNHPGNKTPYNQTSNKLQAPGTSYAPQACYTDVATASLDGPGCMATTQLAQQADYGLRPQDISLLTEGATGIPGGSPDTRIKDNANLPNGPYPLVTADGQSLYDTYGGSPVHRFYQMWQQLDCDVAKATPRNPTGCQADLFPWVEETVSSGSNGNPFPTNPPVPLLKEGTIAMGFFNVAKGDAPYFTKLAREYTLLDNYHQPVMGGTFANQMMFGYADALWYADVNGDPTTPPTHALRIGADPSKPTSYVSEIENPNPAPETNNWYTDDGYGGGSYTNCSDPTQPGVASIVGYLNAVHVPPNCAPGHYYLLNNYVPAYIGSGQQDPINNGPFTLPPVIKQRHIGDVLSAKQVSWAYFGERWNDFKPAPGLGANFGSIAPIAYLYCNICNPFLYSASVMTHAEAREEHLKDTLDLYDAIAKGDLPAVSWVKPSTFNDGHPASSKFSLFESFARRIIEQVKANDELWESTAILVTTDEGGGYYDSGYVQPLDYFGDGTRIPMIVVSKYSRGGRVSHEYTDHASIIKFIERNWDLPTISDRSRDNLPNPKTDDDNPYVPKNRPALGDLFASFDFDGGDHDRGDH